MCIFLGIYCMSNCGLRMRRECRERFARHRLQKKPLVSDPGMHQGTCVTHVPCCMSGSLTCGGGGTVPGIPDICTTRNFKYLARGPLPPLSSYHVHCSGFGMNSPCRHGSGLLVKLDILVSICLRHG